jgi:hypothetical protein
MKKFFDDPRLLRFPPHATGYSQRRAWVLATLCRLAYLDAGPERAAGLAEAGFAAAADFDVRTKDAHTQGLLVAGPDYDVLVFRGTEPGEVRDWITDIDFGARDLGDGVRAHNGFCAAYDAVKDLVAAAMRERGRPFYVTGHSLGGALAVLACFHLDAEPETRRHLAACYTFGCPRVGNLDFLIRLYKFSLYQVVDGDDVVPHMPPRLFSQYGDSGDIRRVFETRRGVVAVKGWGQDLFQRLRTWFWRQLSTAVFWATYVPMVGRVLRWTPDALVSDHFIESYIARLKKLA